MGIYPSITPTLARVVLGLGCFSLLFLVTFHTIYSFISTFNHSQHHYFIGSLVHTYDSSVMERWSYLISHIFIFLLSRIIIININI